ncbi:MAG: tripartite tricarboxylate transporter substrate binding protein [Gammaproteobacteria bacterium]|nr:tripartite tricarboxylate transporter substrate binding protein [Pseudomonadales bacterium]MCP5347913.1 tripartite tricarboxylate transporter substrate binding protein [Pseudomonadales bacterium]
MKKNSNKTGRATSRTPEYPSRLRAFVTLLTGRICLVAIVLLVISPLQAQPENFPERPVTIVVPFGVGGSADRMTRTMANYFADALGQPVNVINRPGAGTLIGANYFLSRPDDGYTILASGFSPYLINTVINGSADYGIDDFAYLNFQWFDEDLIALYRDAPYRDLSELLTAIRDHPKSVRGAVVKGSAGHLTANLLLEANGIPPQNLNLVAYNSGGLARAAVAGGVVDFIIISARGCEGIAEYLKPLAVNNDVPNEVWQVPPLNELLRPLGTRVPVLPGSIRGYAMSSAFRAAYPERFEVIQEALLKTLSNPELQNLLDQASIGRRWIGPEASTDLMKENFELYTSYSHLIQ